MKYRILYTLALLLTTLTVSAQTYTYDNLNRLTKVVYPNGTTVTYTFDALGNRTAKKVTGSNAETFTITTNVTPEGSGTVTGGGTYAKGSVVELNAIANAGFEFKQWSDGETANPRSVTVSKDISYTATFQEQQVPIVEDYTSYVGISQTDWNATGMVGDAAPAVTTRDERTTALAERYVETTSLTGTKLQQTVTGLPAGQYKVVLYANACFTDGRGFTSDITDGQMDVVYLYANDAKLYIPAHIATTLTKNGEYTLTCNVTDGTLRLGMVAEQGGTNWHSMQIKSLERVGGIIVDDLTSYVGIGQNDWSATGMVGDAAPAVTTRDGRATALAERYVETTSQTGTKLKQTVTGLPAGLYKVVLYANACFTDGRGFTSDITDGQMNVVYLYANEAKLYIPAHIVTTVTQNGEYTLTCNVIDGTLRLGMVAERAGTNWHSIQIKSLDCIGSVRGDIVADGQIDQQDLDALVGAYTSNASATGLTDIDGDGTLTIADITMLISMMDNAQTLEGQIVMERKYMVNKANEYCYPHTSIKLDNGIDIQIRYHNTNNWQNSYSKSHHGIYIAVGTYEDVNADWGVSNNDWFDEWYVGPVTIDEWVDEKIVINSDGSIQYFMNGNDMGSHTFDMINFNEAKNVYLDFAPYGWFSGQHHYMDDLLLTLPDKRTVSDNFNDGVLNPTIWQTPTNQDGVREEDGILKLEQVQTDWPYHLRSNAIPLQK